jgi:hypothetical protein
MTEQPSFSIKPLLTTSGELFIYVYHGHQLVATLHLRKSGKYYKLQIPYHDYDMIIEST